MKKTVPHKNAFDAVIFDIDNVLINTRRSYLEVIRWTVEIFLTHGTVPFFVYKKRTDSPQILTRQDISHFKLLGGFNDDWDCCYGLLVYLLKLPVQGRTVPHLLKAKNILKFSETVKKRPLGARGIVEMLGRPPSVKIETISRIFQEIYVGKEVFEKMEIKKAMYWFKRGLIHKEKPIFRKSTLEKMKARDVKLGIATGRSRFEATYVLKRFGIFELFEAITSLGEIRKAEEEARQSLRKPHPFSLVQTAKKMGGAKRFLYVGDLPDDILAAQRAKESIEINSVAFPWHSEDARRTLEEMKRYNPDYLLKKPGDLLALVKSPKRFQLA